MDIILTLLEKLCHHVSGVTDKATLEEQFRLSIHMLNHNPIQNQNDIGVIGDRIKQGLVQEGHITDAAKMARLINKLEQSTFLRNKGNFLYLMLLLKKNQSRCSSRASSDINFQFDAPILLNGYENPFKTPSLHSSESLPSSSGSGTDRKGRHKGMVARMAARYKDNDIKSKPPVPVLPKTSGNLKPAQHREAVTELSEDMLVREVLYSFLGIEGKLVKMDIEKDTFKIDPKVRLSIGQKNLIHKLTEIGMLYNRVKRFCDTYGSSLSKSGLEVSTYSGINTKGGDGGLVNQSFVLALKEELNEYCRLIAVLESQILEPLHTDSPLSSESGHGSQGITLRRLLLWTLEPRQRMRTLALLCDSVRGCRGGASAQAIYNHLQSGDPAHSSIIRRCLSQACRPLFAMLTEWLLDGTLRDLHKEFFIAADSNVKDDLLWHCKYDIRECMLPSFISKSQAEKILATGKSLNFLRHLCHFRAPLEGREAIKRSLQKTSVESLFNQSESSQLEELVELTFKSASSHVLSEIMNRHQLLEHLRALRRYLLLGQGDFIHYLMEVLQFDLDKPATSIQTHNLSSLLETAISSSNAQYESPDVLKRLDVKIFEVQNEETGWDVFSLDYHVDGPIGTVFTSLCMVKYLTLFHSLWMAKRMERILSKMWKQQAATHRLCRDIPELFDTLHRIQLVLTEMIHLVQQLSYYMTFEVLECSWHAFMDELQRSSSLDEVINAHTAFLTRIVAGALVDSDSKDVLISLRALYAQIRKLPDLQERLYTAVLSEINMRSEHEKKVELSTAAGQFGTGESHEIEAAQRQNRFSDTCVNIRMDLNVLVNSYQDLVQCFLLRLAQSEDENLRLLGSRLDFNEHYHRKDQRISICLTYLHRRQTIGTLKSQGVRPFSPGPSKQFW